MDTVAVIVIICITIPAFISITVCAIIYHSYRKKYRAVRRQIILFSDSQYSSEQTFHNNNSDINYYSSQRRRPESLSTFERSSPTAYEIYSLPHIRRLSQSHFSSIQTIPIRLNHHQGSSNSVSPSSLYTISPPSYTELFLTPRTQTNRSETSIMHSTFD